MMIPGTSHDEQRKQEHISAAWGCPYDPLEDFALPGIGSTIASGSLAAAIQHAVIAVLRGINAKMRASGTADGRKNEAISTTSGLALQRSVPSRLTNGAVRARQCRGDR